MPNVMKAKSKEIGDHNIDELQIICLSPISLLVGKALARCDKNLISPTVGLTRISSIKVYFRQEIQPEIRQIGKQVLVGKYASPTVIPVIDMIRGAKMSRGETFILLIRFKKFIRYVK